jgi:lipoprotein-anchoring transpeptidase ErfK/SrfK
VGVGASTLVVAGVLGGCGGGGDSSTTASTTPTTHRPRTNISLPDRATPSTTTAPVAAAPVGTTFVATARLPQVPVFPSAADVTPKTTLANPTENGGPLVFLVEQRQAGWVQVLLPIRPNGSTGWVRAADVTLTANPYSVDIALGAHRLVVHKGGQVVADDSIGVGTSSTPTPGGKYYIKELLKPSNPGGAYGPYAYGLSGFSNVLDDFNGGDGVIGIHGTNDPSTVGHDVSHGCIRLTNADITKLVQVLPLGTPVHISA